MPRSSGADAVFSHHAHIVRGIEFVDGKPVFHGLGNGCVVTHALAPAQDHPVRAAWAERRKQLFGFEPDPAYHLAPFHPEAVNGFMARLVISGERRHRNADRAGRRGGAGPAAAGGGRPGGGDPPLCRGDHGASGPSADPDR